MKCCKHYHSMVIIKIHFGKSQENLKKTFLVGLLNYNRLFLRMALTDSSFQVRDHHWTPIH